MRPWSARLFYAYADALLDAGRTEQAREGFARAAAADTDELTDAAERFDDLDDVVIDDLAGEDGDGDDDGDADGEPADDLAEDGKDEADDEAEPAGDLAAHDLAEDDLADDDQPL